MKWLVSAATQWSIVILAWVLFCPAAGHEVLGCMRLIGRSPECEAQQQAINELWWQYQTLPALTGIAAGYVGLVFLRAVRWRRHRIVRIDPPNAHE